MLTTALTVRRGSFVVGGGVVVVVLSSIIVAIVVSIVVMEFVGNSVMREVTMDTYRTQ